MRFVYILIFLIIVINQCKALLYNDKDDVNIFNESLFASKFQDIPKENWFVQFYHSYCGHCINFAPIFKSFMTEAKHWKWIINFGVIDCSVEKEVCRNQSVKYYPFFKIYPNRSHNNSKIDGITIDLEHDTIETVFKESIRLIESTLDPESLRELKDSDEQSKAPHLIISGPNLVDLKRAVLTYSSRLKYPLWYQLVKDGPYNLSFIDKNTKKSNEYSDLKALYDGLDLFLKIDSVEPDVTTEYTEVTKPGFSSSSKKPNRNLYSTLYPVYNQDMYASIIYALRNEINDDNLNSLENLTILKNFLVQIHNYSGFNDKLLSNIETLIRSVEDKINLKSSRNKFVMSWANMLKFSEFPNWEPTWIGCNGSKPHFRRYPCGLWTAFHILSVNQYIKSHRKDLKAVNPADLIKSIREFIITFFSCRECAENFDKETFDYENSVKTAKDAVLYIWKIHNQVNKRIAKTYSEDPHFPKIAFPPESICSKCYKSTEIVWPTMEEWDEDMVFKYLINHYSKMNVVPFPTHSTLMVRNSTWILSGLSSVDISMCMLLSMFSTLIVIVSFLKYLRDSSFFRQKRTRKYLVPI